ncbi:MAG: hypothetical protein ACYSUA_13995 [Planctomycetota bacterium]|jgi:hypothetical protein
MFGRILKHDGVEDLEVAGHAVEEVGAGGVGEALQGVLLGEVDHLSLSGDTQFIDLAPLYGVRFIEPSSHDSDSGSDGTAAD